MNKITPEHFAEHISSVRGRLENNVFKRTRCTSRATAEDGMSEAILNYWLHLKEGNDRDKDLKHMEKVVTWWACKIVISMQRKDPMTRCSKPELRRLKEADREGYEPPRCCRKTQIDNESLLLEMPDAERQFDAIEKKDADQSLQELVADVLSLTPKGSKTVLRAYLDVLDANQGEPTSTKDVADFCDMTDDGVRKAIGRVRCKIIKMHPEIVVNYKAIIS